MHTPSASSSGEPVNPGSKQKETLWILSEVYYPEVISTGYYLTSIAEGLTDKFDVRVITGQPKHMSRGLKAPKREIRNGVDIYRASATTLDKNVLIYRLINMLTIGVAMFYNSLKRFKAGDTVLVVTAPPTLPLTTAVASLIKGASYTILVQDSYPEILIAVGAVKPHSFFVRFVDRVNRAVYKHASKIIVMGRDMRDLFLKKTAGLDIPIVPIPNWADLESVSPTPRADNKLLNELGLTDKFVLLYAGNIGHPTDVETIIYSAELLQDRTEIHFLFIGAGVKKKWVQEQVSSRRLRNVTVLDYMPREEQTNFLNACDVGLIALIRGMKGTAMPSRTYNIMAVGKPILALAEEGSELAQVIDEDAIGRWLPPHEPEELSRAIIDLYERRSELAAMGGRARDASLKKYSVKKAVADYSKALERP